MFEFARLLDRSERGVLNDAGGVDDPAELMARLREIAQDSLDSDLVGDVNRMRRDLSA